MAEISVQPADLEAKGQALADAAERLKGEMAQIRTATNPTDIFKGAAADQYQQVYDEWDRSQASMLDSLAQLGHWLTSAAQSIQAHDQELARSLGLG